jgi:hypothetical protein
VANSWKKNWQYIEYTINALLDTEFEKKNKTLEEMVDKFNTPITTTADELALLNKGLKYN